MKKYVNNMKKLSVSSHLHVNCGALKNSELSHTYIMYTYLGNIKKYVRNMWKYEKYEGICGKYEGIPPII